MKIKIFYSWQSGDVRHNKNFISDCIKDAVRKTEQNPNFKNIDFEVVDAVRNEVGQVAVADSIIQKIIPDCDIFIADLTANRVNKIVRLLTQNKPAPNPNVMTEYGVALNSLGKQRIISVINTNNNGSPKDNAEIIPFDLRHDRFPTEYCFSKKNENKKSIIKKEFINDLVNILKPTIQNVLETQKSKFRPFIVWNEWNDLQRNPQADKFIRSNKFQEIKTSVTNTTNINPIRILGLSGLGKTRIVFEIFRPQNNDNDSLLFSNRALYVNCNDHPEKINFVDLVSKISAEKNEVILIVDNCDLETHRIIAKNLKGLSLISIDSNPEENCNTEGTNYVIIGKNDLSDVVAELVNNDFQNVGKDNIQKIKDFSQGIPLMAVLLADSITKGERFLGRLDDKELLDKLLGSKGKEQEWRNILKSCSMFSCFGFEKEFDLQYKFIATNENITISNNSQQVRINTFLSVVNHFKEREIFEKQGRFLSIRPFPLAMALAVEWLDTCTSERLLQVITDISNLEEPHRKQMIRSLAEQMKYLGYNDKAVEIVGKIIGPDSPFDNAEVLNTELGSRLFRSFVEVNPVAVSENFIRVFSNKTTAELSQIIEGRRNLVWVLEKLCFDKRTFADSVKILFSFAIAENETWSNNATGQFLHLFYIHLSGTEANLSERWKIIEWGLNKGDVKYYDLAIKAMKVGLNFGYFTRTGGAELQGSKRLYDNNPTWEEIKDYWSNILYKLLEIIKSNNEYSDSTSEIVASRIRGLFRAQMGDLIMPVLKEITESKNYDWDSGLMELKYARKYEKNSISEKLLEEVNYLITSLTKADFSTKYLTLSNSSHLDNDETYSSEKVIGAIKDLADEFLKTEVSWEETFFSFYKNQQPYSYHFGKRLSELLQDDKTRINRFIDFSLEVISQIPQQERSFTVLGGFIVNSNEDVKREFYSNIFQSAEFSCQLFYFLSIDKSGSRYFDLLFKLIDNKVCELSNFYFFSYSNVLLQMSLEELNVFSERLFAYGDEGYAIVFDLFFNIGYRNESKKNSLTPISKKCILKLGYNRNFKRQLDDYNWSEVISLIINNEKEVEFAQFINKSIINSITWENTYHLDYYVQRIYEILMKVHFGSIWRDLSDALLADQEDYIKFYGLKHILGSHIGGVGRSVGILFEGDIDSIFKWCESNKPLAPSRLAELTPIFDNNKTGYLTWHPVALRLLNEFGDLNEVLGSLSSNMGSYSWTGSVVPFLESKQKLFRQIINHKIESVRIWANSYIGYLDKDIEAEKNRDAERFL